MHLLEFHDLVLYSAKKKDLIELAIIVDVFIVLVVREEVCEAAILSIELQVPLA